VKRLLSALLLAPVRAYQRWLSPLLPRRCKYEPTCSAYAVEAISELGPTRGLVVAAWRVLRCNPFSDGGIDDLADRTLFKHSATRPRTRPVETAPPGSDDPGAGQRRTTAVSH
jgi:uncharacterized protein